MAVAKFDTRTVLTASLDTAMAGRALVGDDETARAAIRSRVEVASAQGKPQEAYAHAAGHFSWELHPDEDSSIDPDTELILAGSIVSARGTARGKFDCHLLVAVVSPLLVALSNEAVGF